jgi:hypothetical protein
MIDKELFCKDKQIKLDGNYMKRYDGKSSHEEIPHFINISIKKLQNGRK